MVNLINWKKSVPVSVETHRKNPFLALQSELDKAMRDFYSLFEMPSIFDKFEDLTISPFVDLVEDKDSFKVEAEMPGLGEEDIKVSISDGILTIRGEKTTSKQDENKNYLAREINYGCYERNIALPDSVDAEKAKASFKKGMLWVNIPKKAEAAKKVVNLKLKKLPENSEIKHRICGKFFLACYLHTCFI